MQPPRPSKSFNLNPNLHQRSRWKHYIRWFFLAILIMIDWALFSSLLRNHFTPGHVVTMNIFLKELLTLTMLTFCNLTVIPSILLEVDKVEVTPDKLILHLLFFKRKENWDDIVKYMTPNYLKFHIVKSKSFIYLLNKRDLNRYDDLMQTIRHKATSLSAN